MAYSLKYTYNDAKRHYIVAGWANIALNDKVIIPAIYNDGIHGEHSVAVIGYEAFKDCKTLTSINIPYSVTTIAVRAFYGCESLRTITLSLGLIKIETGAFAFCTNLTSITIPDTVTSLGLAAFNNCGLLRNVVISNKLTSIPGYAFQYCYSLTNITIPDSVTSIGDYAFLNCHNLKTVILFPETPPELGSGVIPSTISTIYVQQSSKGSYKIAKKWAAFSKKIVSDNLYLSFVRFNQKNKEYIAQQIQALKEYIDGRL